MKPLHDKLLTQADEVLRDLRSSSLVTIMLIRDLSFALQERENACDIVMGLLKKAEAERDEARTLLKSAISSLKCTDRWPSMVDGRLIEFDAALARKGK